MAAAFRVAGVEIPVHLRIGFRLPSGTPGFSFPDLRICPEPGKHRRGTLRSCSNQSSGEKVWSRVMKDKAFDPFPRRSSGSRKVAGHVVRTGRLGSPVDILWSQLPRPEGRSLFTTPAPRPEFWEQAGLTRESGSQSATSATGRQDPLRDASSVPDTGRWGSCW